MIGYGMGGRPVPPYSWDQARTTVKAGGSPVTEAARLQRWEHYHERIMAHSGDVYLPAFRPMRPELVRLNRRWLAKRRRQRFMERLHFWKWFRLPRIGEGMFP